MNFKPKSEQDIENQKLLDPGEYPFTVENAIETESKNHNSMIELQVKIIANGSSRVVKDYLLPQRAEKLLHCCIACACRSRYDSGELTASDFKGRSGRLLLKIEKGGKSEKGKWPDKNVIEDYLTA